MGLVYGPPLARVPWDWPVVVDDILSVNRIAHLKTGFAIRFTFSDFAGYFLTGPESCHPQTTWRRPRAGHAPSVARECYRTRLFRARIPRMTKSLAPPWIPISILQSDIWTRGWPAPSARVGSGEERAGEMGDFEAAGAESGATGITGFRRESGDAGASFSCRVRRVTAQERRTIAAARLAWAVRWLLRGG